MGDCKGEKPYEIFVKKAKTLATIIHAFAICQTLCYIHYLLHRIRLNLLAYLGRVTYLARIRENLPNRWTSHSLCYFPKIKLLFTSKKLPANTISESYKLLTFHRNLQRALNLGFSEVLEKKLNRDQCEAVPTFTSTGNIHSNIFKYSLASYNRILEMPTFGMQRALKGA